MTESQFYRQNPPRQGAKLLERLRLRLQGRGFGLDMQNRYAEWCRQFICSLASGNGFGASRQHSWVIF